MEQKLQLQHKGGFTLLEMLVVLIIVCLCTFIITNNIYEVYQQYQLKSTCNKFINEVSSIQNLSATTNKKSYIKLNSGGYMIYYDDQLVNEVTLPKSITMSNNFDDVISFNQWGNISRAGTVTFKRDDEIVEVSFAIGNGHYQIK